jgi:hypothetical protein
LGHLSASLLSHCPVKGYSFLLGLKRRGLQGAIHAVSEATVSRVRPRPRRSQRHRHDRWKATPTAADALRRCDQGKRHGFQTLLAAYRGAPKGAPNVLLIMTDDRDTASRAPLAALSLRRPWTVSPRQDCATRSSILPRSARNAGGTHHRPQSPLGRLRRHRRNVHRLPGL